MKEVGINTIFPTTVCFYDLERPFTPEEIDFFEKSKAFIRDNEGNKTSVDNYILDTPELSGLKSEIEQAIHHYMFNVMCYKDSVQPYITQSWLNYTTENEYHHKHSHPNSFISGVLYIDADFENDKIYFFNDGHKFIKPQINQWNLHNSESWFFNVKTSQTAIFPSHLQHMVKTKGGQNVRTSLAFNTFLKGDIGVNQELTELKL
jgi:uncharacterized protein (TIGR02466 family)